MDEIPEGALLYLPDSYGVYVPQAFAEMTSFDIVEGVNEEEWKILLDGPDNEQYWDVWTDVLDTATLTSGGKTYSLWQDGDLWLVPEEGQETRRIPSTRESGNA